MNKAYSLLELKSFDEDERVIRGWATSPRPDRVGDVVEPSGVTAAGDIPLFLYHDSTKTVGRATLGKATPDGVPFEARLPAVSEPGVLKDRVDEAWGMVRYGLINAVSIGFRPLDGAVESIKSGGTRFLKTEVMELSLVPVPAQPDARILSVKSLTEAQRAEIIEAVKGFDSAPAIKSIDQQHLSPASGPDADPAPAPGVSGHTKAAPVGPVSLISRRKDALK